VRQKYAQIIFALEMVCVKDVSLQKPYTKLDVMCASVSLLELAKNLIAVAVLTVVVIATVNALHKSRAQF
jgi:hypothetical protein